MQQRQVTGIWNGKDELPVRSFSVLFMAENRHVDCDDDSDNEWFVCVCVCLMELFGAKMEERMRMEHWQNDTERGKPQYLEKNLSHAHFVHYKFHMDWLGSEQDLCGENP